MHYKSEFEYILYYILKKATPDEIAGIEMAIEKRKKNQPLSLKDLDFEELAKQISSQVSGSFHIDVKAMARRIVANLILEKEPNISEEHLEKLLEYYVQTKKKTKIPREILLVMIEHFLNYSLGKMPKKLIDELNQTSPQWYEKYWNAFPYQIRSLIAELLKANIDSEDFWQRLNKIMENY